MPDNKPKYIDGVGYRCDVEHSHKRRLHQHRYNEASTYMITIVVAERKRLFGEIKGNIKAAPQMPDYPATVLSPLGERVINEEIPKIHHYYPMAEVWQVCIMPDHIHLILRIKSTLPEGKTLGQIIGAFKGGISRAWGEGSLFEEGFNDRILMRDGQLENWKAYLRANPFRWLLRHTRPDVMQRAQCLIINGVRYGAFGNFLLLRHPEKTQVFFHRQMEDDRRMPIAQGQKIPTEDTQFWQDEHTRLIELAQQGDVLVTPGISECEKRIKNECLKSHYRLIHLQAEPIGNYWKPERSRFNACAEGTLLILAPWQEDLQGDSNYARFHNLNALAKTICALPHDANCTKR